MTIFKDTIMIRDWPWNRAVEVTVITPDDVNVLDVQSLAERAWRTVGKEIRLANGVTVKVRALKR